MLSPFVVSAPIQLIMQFDGKETAVAIAYAILLLAAGLGLLTWRQHRRFIGPLRAAAGAITESARPGQTLGARLDAAGTALAGAGLGGRWTAYRAAIEDSPVRPGQAVNLLPPADWFALERLPGRGYERWAQTWPGVFLTTGLLFTFIGLAAALLRVGDAGTGADLLASTSAVLRISSAKFITSIAGLLAYIAWTLGARGLQIQQSNTARALADAIQALTTPVTPEALLMAQVRLARQQSAQLHTLPGALAAAVDATLSPRFAAVPASIATASDALAGAVVEAGTAMRHVNEEALDRMVARLGNDLRLSAGVEMRAVSAALHDAASELAEARNHIGQAGAHAAAELGAAATALRMAATVVDVTVSGAANKAAEALRDGADAAAGTLAAAGQAAGSAMQAAAGKAGREAAAGLETSASRLAAAVNGSAERMECSGSTVADHLDGAGRHLGTAQTALAAHLQQYDGLGRTVADATDEFGRAAKSLRGMLKPATSAMQTAEQAAALSHAVLAEAGSAVSAIHAASALLQGAATASRDAVEQHLLRVQTVDDSLARTVQALGGVARQHAPVTEGVA